MGVDFLICNGCNETYPDCSSRCVSCDEEHGGCQKSYCSPDCAELKNWDKEPYPTFQERQKLSQEQLIDLWCSCIDCRGEAATDEKLLAFALEKLELTRSHLIEEFLSVRREERAAKVQQEHVRLFGQEQT